MKRSFSRFDGAQEPVPAGATPRNLIPRPNVGGTGAQKSGKRTKHIQTNLKSFWSVETPTDKDTPMLGQPAPPSTNGAGECSNVEWPSTAQRALENLRVNTPGLPSIGHEVGPLHPSLPGEEDDNSRQYADTCVHPLSMGLGGESGYDDFIVKTEDIDEEDNAGFRISSSQTYFRPPTQQEPADERSTSWENAWDVHQARKMASQPSDFRSALAAKGLCLAPAAEDVDDTVSVLTQAADQTDTLAQPSHRVTPLQAGSSAAQGPSHTGINGMMMSIQGGAHADHAQATAPPGQGSGAHAEQAVTPELAPVLAACELNHAGDPHSGDHHQLMVQPGPAKPLAALFRPRNQRKLLLVVRHGESEYNRAVSESKTYADPLIFDPHLTQKGINQCKELQRNLTALLAGKAAEYGEPLWVVSPLTRALQTFLMSCPYPDRITAAQPGPLATHDNNAGNHAGTSASHQALAQGRAGGSTSAVGCSTSRGHPAAGGSSAPGPRLSIEVLPSISEFMATPGDVGRPPAELAKEFPQLSEQLAHLPEIWWHHTANKKSCALKGTWEGGEPSDRRKQRVAEFSRWLSNRSERLFVLVGHSCFWYSFMGKQHDMLRNCEVMTLTW